MLSNIKFYLKTLNVYRHYKLKRYIPFLVIISPTMMCNLRCQYCEQELYKQTRDIEANKVYELIDEMDEIGIPCISFSGGEPLLIKGIEDIGDYAKKKNIFVNLNTNGTLIDKKRAQKIATSFDHIRISLDGSEELHDKICGVKGTYKKVLKSIDYLISIPNRKARIGLNYVLTENNIHNIKEFSKKFKKKVDFISFLPVFSFRHGCKQESHGLNKDLIKISRQLEIKEKSENTKDCITNINLEYSRKICDAGKLYVCIIDGYVYACPFPPVKNYLHFRLGSIYEESLHKILNRKKDINFSERCLGCCATCTTEISRIFRMSPFKLASNFFYFKKTYKL